MTQPATHEGTVTARIGPTGYRVEIDASGHALVADEPTDAGGTDAGATPYDLVLAALGACTAMTLRMYADRKQWPLEGVTVHMHHSRSHAVDEHHCEHRPGRLDPTKRPPEITGHLRPEQRVKLAEFANRCRCTARSTRAFALRRASPRRARSLTHRRRPGNFFRLDRGL